MIIPHLFQKWLNYRLSEANRRVAQGAFHLPGGKLELPEVKAGTKQNRQGIVSSILFLAFLFSPAWGAAVGYFVFDDLYQGGRAKGLGVAAGMTFIPAIVFLGMLVLGGMSIMLRREQGFQNDSPPGKQPEKSIMPWCSNGHPFSLSDGTCICGSEAVFACPNGHQIVETERRPSYCRICGVTYPWAPVRVNRETPNA